MDDDLCLIFSLCVLSHSFILSYPGLSDTPVLPIPVVIALRRLLSHLFSAEPESKENAEIEYNFPSWSKVKMSTQVAGMAKPKTAKLTSKFGFLKKPMAVGSDAYVFDEENSTSLSEAWAKAKIIRAVAGANDELQYVRAM